MISFFKKIFKLHDQDNSNVQEEIVIEEELHMYDEHQEEEPEVIAPTFTIKELREIITTNFAKSEKRLLKLYKDYYILKLFSRAANKNGRFNEKMLFLDKQVNYNKRLYEELKRKMDIVKYMNDVTLDELTEINNKVNNYIEHQQQTLFEASEINRQHYNKIKLASAGIIINKNSLELEKFHREVNDFIYQYKSLQEAAEFVYYHSGELIVQTVNSLTNSLAAGNNQEITKNYDYSFFLETSTVLTLPLAQWIDLFNKIRYVLRTTNEVNVINYVDFKNNYQKLEVRYFILMLYMESKSKDDDEAAGINDFYI